MNPSTRYTIELRFILKENSVNITEILGLSPTNWSSEISKRPKGDYLWAYNGHKENGFKKEWDNLNEGFTFIFENIRYAKPKIIALAEMHEAIWWCGCFYCSINGAYLLSPFIIKELSEYGFPLFMDNYFHDDDS